MEFATELEGGQAPHCPRLGVHTACWYGYRTAIHTELDGGKSTSSKCNVIKNS